MSGTPADFEWWWARESWLLARIDAAGLLPGQVVEWAESAAGPGR